MISELSIQNIALISKLQVSFSEGFNVLSGETGAGKSIIVDSVNLILGSRADKDLIRAGQETAYVEAQIELPEDIDRSVLQEYDIAGDSFVVSRELSVSGRNVCRINGRLTSLAVLREVMHSYVDIYGQNQNMSLLDESYHLALIDTYGAKQIDGARAQAAESYGAYVEARQALDKLNTNAAEKLRLIDLYTYQVGEIERAALRPGEGEELQAEKKRMLNAEKIASALEDAKAAVTGDRGAVGMLYEAMRNLQHISGLDERYAAMEKTLSDAYYAIEDASYELADMAGAVNYDERRLNDIEMRLSEINGLKRKYGSTEEAVLEYCETCKIQLEQLENSEVRMEALQKQEAAAREAMEEAFLQLTQLRKDRAAALCRELQRELAELGMKDAELVVEFERTAYTQNGWDGAALLISVNRGTPPRKLAKVASGGEISRVMLAIKNIVAQNEPIHTMIFDEIDTGISGTMAQIVARKIANISRQRQVICVTHLPQIAAMGDHNFYIQKAEQAGMVTTTVERITGEGLEAEIARLSGGIQSRAAKLHARELLDNATQIKANL